MYYLSAFNFFCIRAHFEKLLEYCETGVKEGATLAYGGKAVDGPGEDRRFQLC